MNCVVCGKYTTLEVYDKSTGKTEPSCLEHSGRVFEFGSCVLTDLSMADLDRQFRETALTMSTEDTEGLDIELLDRLDTTLKLIDMLLIDHKRAIHCGVADKIEEASSILADVYQEVGGEVI